MHSRRDDDEYPYDGVGFMRGCIIGLMFSVPAWVLIILAIVRILR